MVFKCCVIRCNNNNNVSKMHRFPRDEELCKAWLTRIGRADLQQKNPDSLRRTYRVCDVHFGPEAQYVGSRNKSNIRKDAIPSLYLQENVPSTSAISDESEAECVTPVDPIIEEEISSIILSNCISDEVPVIETPSSTIVPAKDSNDSGSVNDYNTNELAVSESLTKCRFCMMEIIEAKNILEDYIDHVPIHLAVKVCLYPIEVSITDRLSTYVCIQCLNTVSSILKFRSMVLRNDKILRKQLDESIPLVSKKIPDQKRNIDKENEPHLMQKIKIDQVPELNYYYGIRNGPNSTNQGEEKRNKSTENVSHSQQVAKSTIPQLTLISSSAGFIKASLQKTNNLEQGGREVPKAIIREDKVKQPDSDVSQHVEKSKIQLNINKSSSATPISIIGSYGVSKRPKLANQDDEQRNNSNEKVSPDQQVGKFIVQLDISKSSETPVSQSAALVEALLPKTYNNEQEAETIPVILEDNIEQLDSDISPGLLVVQSEIEIDNNKLSSGVPTPVIRTYAARKRPKLTNQDEQKQNRSKENLSTDQQVAKSKIQLDINQSPSATPISRSIAFVEGLLKKTTNEEQERGTMPRTLILEKVNVSEDSQSNYDNVAFCLADGYLMEHKILKGNLRYLKCALAKCPAVGTQKVLIPGLFENRVSISKRHNHERPTEMDIKKQKFISVIRKRLQTAKGLSIKSIYDEVCKLYPDLAQLVPMKDLKKAICNL